MPEEGELPKDAFGSLLPCGRKDINGEMDLNDRG